MITIPVPEWTLDAICAQIGGDAWYPEKGGNPGHIKAVCTGCPVRSQCLDYALENGEAFGIWGGLTAKQRRKLRRESEAA